MTRQQEIYQQNVDLVDSTMTKLLDDFHSKDVDYPKIRISMWFYNMLITSLHDFLINGKKKFKMAMP